MYEGMYVCHVLPSIYWALSCDITAAHHATRSVSSWWHSVSYQQRSTDYNQREQGAENFLIQIQRDRYAEHLPYEMLAMQLQPVKEILLVAHEALRDD